MLVTDGRVDKSRHIVFSTVSALNTIKGITAYMLSTTARPVIGDSMHLSPIVSRPQPRLYGRASTTSMSWTGRPNRYINHLHLTRTEI